MAQTNTGIPSKGASGRLSAVNVNSIAATLNANSSDLETRAQAIETSNVPGRFKVVDDTDVSNIRTYNTEDLPTGLTDGTIVFDTMAESPVYYHTEQWHRVSDEVALNTLPEIDLFVIMGQSNADGKGQLANLTITPTVNLADTEMYFSSVDASNNNEWLPGTWDTMNVGTNTSLAPGRFGVEYGMAENFYALKSTYPDAFATHPAFLKHAKGSTDLANDWDSADAANFMYSSMEKAVADAKYNLGQKGYRVKLRGFVWFQGETDASDQTKANAYQSNLTAFIADIRARFNTPALPVVICKIAYASNPPAYLSTVQAAQQAVADNDSNIEIIDTAALARRDSVHLNADSTFTLGQSIAATFGTMI
jgi:hypothetical protein